MPELRHHLYTYSILLVAVTLNACAAPSYWPEVQGQVLDETTNQPVDGAIVVARWQGHRNHAFIKSRQVCYHVETTTTDIQGRFSFASRMDGVSMAHDRFIAYRVYKAGYMTSDKTYEKEIYKKNLKYLRPFRGTREERLRYLFRLHTGCSGAEGSNKNLYSIRKSIYEEANLYVRSSEEKRKLELKLWAIEEIEYGVEAAAMRHYQRLGVSK